MKGLTHFVTGLTAASFFPVAVQAAADGIPWYFVAGGAAALLPDTVDFKFLRFFQRHDVAITPEAESMDPAAIAATVARVIDTAADQGKPLTLKLNTLARPGNGWQAYSVRVDPRHHTVTAAIGPIVTTSRAARGWTPVSTATASTRVEAFPAYQAETVVDILDGPTLAMQPQADGRIRVDFIPWHRQASHSLITGLGLGGLTALLWNPTAGLIVWMGHGLHVLADQLGFMGSNLWYPFTRRRTVGLHRLHAMDPWSNTPVIWISLLLILWNLSRAAGPPFTYSLPRLLFFGALLPMLAIRWATRGHAAHTATGPRT